MDHLVLRVSDFASAVERYSKLFAFAGWKTIPDPEDKTCIGFRDNDGFTLWIREQRDASFGPKQGHLDHFAFKCASRDEVNKAHQFCTEQQWKILSEPKPDPRYGDFYGFAFEGPDGLKIEFVTRF